MLHLDYFSCLLTVLSTVMIGRRLWQGWLVAGANSVLICIIALRAAQPGFIYANVFCLAIYGYNLLKWRTDHDEAPRGAQNRRSLGTPGFHRKPKARLLRMLVIR